MTFEELKKDKRLRKLKELLPGLDIKPEHVTMHHFNMAGDSVWYSVSKFYSNYEDFSFQEFALAVIKYDKYGRQR